MHRLRKAKIWYLEKGGMITQLVYISLLVLIQLKDNHFIPMLLTLMNKVNYGMKYYVTLIWEISIII